MSRTEAENQGSARESSMAAKTQVTALMLSPPK